MKKSLLAISAASLFLAACSNQSTSRDFNKVVWCDPAETKTEKIDLAADALFKFGKSQRGDLLAKGEQSLNELAQKISTGYATIHHINLIGHTDRLGDGAKNYQLGLARANTVKAYLQSKGIKAPITASSAGETQPVTTSCVGDKATPALTECLQADRRVVVEIAGTKEVVKDAAKPAAK